MDPFDIDGLNVRLRDLQRQLQDDMEEFRDMAQMDDFAHPFGGIDAAINVDDPVDDANNDEPAAGAENVLDREDNQPQPEAVATPDVPKAENEKEKEDEADDTILTSKGTEMKGLSCGICYDPFNTGKRIPKVFPCGHTICLQCIKKLLNTRTFLGGNTVICPSCRQNTRYSLTTPADKIPTNFCIQSLLEQRQQEKSTKEPEAVKCTECHTTVSAIEATTCSDETCQKEISEEELKNVDKIKRPKETLICRSCIETNHSTHIFVSFSNVAAQYEANKKILLAESLLKKKLKAVDEALLAFDKTKAEAIDHRRRMANALVNIRKEADHPDFYESLNRFMSSMKSSGELFKTLSSDLDKFENSSKARYHRSFGRDVLRPSAFPQETDGSKQEVKQAPAPVPVPPARPRPGPALNRERFRRLGAVGGFVVPIVGRDANAPGGVRHLANEIDEFLAPNDQGLAAHFRRIFGDLPDDDIAIDVQIAAAAPAGDAPAAGGGDDAVDGAGDFLGPAADLRLAGAAGAPLNIADRMYRRHRIAARAQLAAPRRANRNGNNVRDLRMVRHHIFRAIAQNPGLHRNDAIQQAIDGLRDYIWNLEGPYARNPFELDQIDMRRDLDNAQQRLNQLGARLQELEGNLRARDDPAQDAPWHDVVVQEPLNPLPPIQGIEQEVADRAEIAELVNRIMGMVRNEAEAEANANGQRAPKNIEMPALLNPDANPDAPNFKNLQPLQVQPYLRDLRALELEWIQKAQDRRARGGAQPPVEDVEQNPVVEGGTDAQRRAVSPTQDEPAAKRNRQ
ncbi:RING-type domain-containing protein [Caenorhabditis elegans]|uniref:RING-type domain-containing protein n=1 Tax=Caenorhabditis elegans TaxID=6239 RepID=P91482_CAEEL|nr:RING-type domain-containing protein [Caenorhabditis elegans]CCD67781.1 RING-type domain-containing protein [Caenorhabditis elegans]|eukprot:NP_491266.1 Uncharacterized protein CELE_T20F5.6 [Caenorhabditis elegans]